MTNDNRGLEPDLPGYTPGDRLPPFLERRLRATVSNVDDKSDVEYLLSGGGGDTPEPYVDPVVTVFFGMQHVQLARHEDDRYEGRWAAVWEHGDGRAYRSYRATAAGAALATLWRAAREAQR